VALSVGAIVLVIWLLAAARGPQAYAVVQRAIASWIGQVVLFGTTFAFFLHFCGGIRHLVWDTVHGFELRSIYISGWSVVAASIVLTVRAAAAGLYVVGSPDESRILPLSASTRHRSWLGQTRFTTLVGRTGNGG